MPVDLDVSAKSPLARGSPDRPDIACQWTKKMKSRLEQFYQRKMLLHLEIRQNL
jgi:hypothetical protein